MKIYNNSTKRYLTLLFVTLLAVGTALAQPDWAKKAAKSMLTLKTFSADGTLIGSTNGFFISENGDVISSFAPFVGASRVAAFNAKGKEMNVECVLGANETYDIIKLRVTGKDIAPLSISEQSPAAGASLWLLPYTVGKNVKCERVAVDKIEKFNETYEYLTLGIAAPENSVSCPLLNDAGEVVAVMQQASGSYATGKSYAVSASFAKSLTINGLSLNDAALKKTSIKIALPDELDQALLTLYIGGQTKDSASYAGMVDDFIAKFPQAPDGYVSRAQLLTSGHNYEEADKNMEKAIEVATKKDDVHYNYSKMIYSKVALVPNPAYAPWTFDRAAEEADKAYAINPLPVYRQLKAQIYYIGKRYDEAYNVYDELIKGGNGTAELFFEAANCKEMLGDTISKVALLDSAVNTFSKPYLKEAAPYILARAQAQLEAKQYRKAVVDFNEYEKLLPTQVNANFYYVRAQAEIQGRLYQQALNDLAKAASMSNNNTFYLSEKASLEVRLGLYDEAIITATECIASDATVSDGYLFLGLSQCLKGNKTEGVKNLQKAKELGDAQADGLIEKYGK